MTTALTTTTLDTDHFSTLPAKVRREIDLWIEVCERVDQAKSVSAGVRTEAQRLSHLKGFSAPTIKRRYYAWKTNGWQGLINNAKVGKKGAAQTIGEHFKGYCEQNQRSCREAYNQMMRDFRKGKYFEDVGTWLQVWQDEKPTEPPPKVCPRGWTPIGWTYSSLMRSCGLNGYEKTASRIGRGAARDFLPGMYSTRLGLLPGMIYQFDDMWHDARVNFGNNKVARRAIELACLDVASASRIAYGLKPRREDIDGKKLKNLTALDMRMLLAHVLINIGYHPAGCTMIVEHGTAAADRDLELLIGNLSGGSGYYDEKEKKIVWRVPPVVRLQRSGIISEQIHKGLFFGQPRGNFKLKAALESQHSLMHTAAASLPGQMGKDRDHSPEQQYGMQQYNRQLIKAAAALPPERAKLLRYPFLDFKDYAAVIGELYDILDWRTEHDLEGWDNNTATEFRASAQLDHWLPMDKLLALPAPEQAALNALIEHDPYAYCRVRKLSPREVWQRGQAELVRLPKTAMPLILGEELGVIRPVQADGLITFHNAEFGPGEYRYLAREIATPDGFRIHLTAGQKYLIHINPFDIGECFVSDLQGCFLGIARRWETVSKVDIDALNRMAGKQAKIESELRTPLARRGAKIIKDKAKMHEHNADVMSGAPVTDEELEAAEMVESVRVTKKDRAAAFEPDYQADDDDQISGDELYELIGGNDAE